VPGAMRKLGNSYAVVQITITIHLQRQSTALRQLHNTVGNYPAWYRSNWFSSRLWDWSKCMQKLKGDKSTKRNR